MPRLVRLAGGIAGRGPCPSRACSPRPTTGSPSARPAPGGWGCPSCRAACRRCRSGSAAASRPGRGACATAPWPRWRTRRARRLVLTAHHANDQLETHRLRSLRGAGAARAWARCATARRCRVLPHCLLLRPFLGVERRRILDYRPGARPRLGGRSQQPGPALCPQPHPAGDRAGAAAGSRQRCSNGPRRDRRVPGSSPMRSGARRGWISPRAGCC